MINHDCRPNARIFFDENKRLHLVAKRNIEQGQEITITYCSPLLATKARRHKLLQNKFFLCQCQRCQDPTEFGSYMSAVKCTKCKTGIILNYSCVECGFETSCDKVEKLEETAERMCEKVLQKSSVDFQETEKILKRLLERFHQNHFIIVNFKAELINQYSKINSILSVERRIELLKERIDLLIQVDDNESRLFGFLSFKLHCCFVEKASLMQRKGSQIDEILKSQINNTFKDSLRILSDDASCPKELKDISDAISLI